MKQLAETSGNLSIVFFGSVITQALPGVDSVNPRVVVLGISIGGLFLIESLILLKEIKDNEY